MNSYYLCSEGVFNLFPQFEYSKPFKSGYGFDVNNNFYIAYLDDNQYKAIENYYDQNNKMAVSQMFDKPNCSGDGRRPCRECDGDGDRECEECDGRGSVDCPECQ